MSSESETDIDDDIFELACNYKLTGKYPKDCPQNKKRTIRRQAKSIILQNGEVWKERKMNGKTKVVRLISEAFEKQRILHSCHSDPTSGHLGIKRTIKRIRERLTFTWKGLNTESNGLDERYNQTLQSMLSKAVMGHKEMWDEFIDSAVFAYNTSTHESTTYSPFEVMFGRKARLPVEADLRPIPSNYDSRLAHAPNTSNQMAQVAKERQEILKDVKRNILAAQAKQKQHYDAKHTRAKLFDVGVQVLKKDFLRKKRKGGKLDPRWLGPYIITQKLSKGFYSLQSVANPSDCVKRVNGAHLKAFHSQEHMSNSQDLSQSSSPLSPRHSILIPTFQSAFAHSFQSVYATAFQSVYTTAFQSVYTTAFQSVYTTAFQSVYTTAFQSTVNN
ncbi:hypothetical protein EMCRGX_G000810 [Ephydatia muelleri]